MVYSTFNIDLTERVEEIEIKEMIKQEENFGYPQYTIFDSQGRKHILRFNDINHRYFPWEDVVPGVRIKIKIKESIDSMIICK